MNRVATAGAVRAAADVAIAKKVNAAIWVNKYSKTNTNLMHKGGCYPLPTVGEEHRNV